LGWPLELADGFYVSSSWLWIAAFLATKPGMNSITFSPLLSPAILRWACEHFGSVAWPQHTVHIPLVAMTADKGAAVTDSASAEVSDTFAFTIWLHRKR
jgi:hypothetical protein